MRWRWRGLTRINVVVSVPWITWFNSADMLLLLNAAVAVVVVVVVDVDVIVLNVVDFSVASRALFFSFSYLYLSLSLSVLLFILSWRLITALTNNKQTTTNLTINNYLYVYETVTVTDTVFLVSGLWIRLKITTTIEA